MFIFRVILLLLAELLLLFSILKDWFYLLDVEIHPSPLPFLSTFSSKTFVSPHI